MTGKAREAAFGRICQSALAVSYAFVTAAEIDEINIHRAVLLAMERAVEALFIERRMFWWMAASCAPPLPGTAIIKGDSSSLSIAAAP